MINRKKTNRGFTIIELLVVIAIIALLASVVSVSLARVKSKANDSYRLTSLIKVRTALALYYAKYGQYPHNRNLWDGDNYWGSNPMPSDWKTTYILGLAPEFINTLPLDPKIVIKNPGGNINVDGPTGNGFQYQSKPSAGQGPAKHYKFRLYQTLENPPAIPSSSSFYDPARSGDVWMVTDRYDLPPVSPVYTNATSARDICLYVNTPGVDGKYPGSWDSVDNGWVRDDYPICY